MRPWPVIRALLIGILLMGQWIDALPLPVLREQDLKYPIAQNEITRWTAMLNSLGADLTEEEAVAGALKVGEAAIQFRKISMAPIRPIKRWTGTGQSWGLFAYPDPFAGRLVIRARPEEGDWQTLFSAPGSRLDPYHSKMRYRRVRGIYDDNGDRPTPGKLYNRFCDWVAWELFQENPDLVTVEIRLDMVRIIPPGGEEPPPDKRRHVRTRQREDLTRRLQKRWSQ